MKKSAAVAGRPRRAIIVGLGQRLPVALARKILEAVLCTGPPGVDAKRSLQSAAALLSVNRFWAYSVLGTTAAIGEAATATQATAAWPAMLARAFIRRFSFDSVYMAAFMSGQRKKLKALHRAQQEQEHNEAHSGNTRSHVGSNAAAAAAAVTAAEERATQDAMHILPKFAGRGKSGGSGPRLSLIHI